MKLGPEQIRKLNISPVRIFGKLVRWGWVSTTGRSLQWFEHQRPNHDEQFQEPRERKQKKKFKRKENNGGDRD